MLNIELLHDIISLKIMKIQFLLKNTGMFERLGIMTLSSSLKGKGHDVKLTLTEELNEKGILDVVNDYKPEFLPTV